MGKPRMIILIRHAQSEGNKNRAIHQTIPDHRVKLTQEGWTQAHDAGRRLRSMLRADDTLHFFTSPYRRTRETTEGILETLTTDDPSPSPFPRRSIKVYEEPRLREQDFGNFQPCSAEMERMWQERADYGHFFYRIPNGESAADAYDRVSGFNESLWRQFGEEDFASVCVLVTHGLMSRVFLMKWYHFSVEYFEDLRNVNHCEFLIMRKKEDSGKYILESQLRTWSDLRRQREAERREKEKHQSLDKVPESALTLVPKRRKWGGCPNGCDHGRNSYRREKMQQNGKEAYAGESPVTRRPPPARRWQSSSEEDEDDPRGRVGPPAKLDLPAKPDLPKVTKKIISSPDDTGSFSSAEDCAHHRLKPPHNIPILQAGRDFGGSASGNVSRANSDEDASVDDESWQTVSQAKAKLPLVKKKLLLSGRRRSMGKRADSGMGRGVKANALGDQSDICTEGEANADDDDEPDDQLEKEEAADKSLRGSVY